MRVFSVLLATLLVVVRAFVAGVAAGLRGRLPADAKLYKAPDGKGYEYTNSPGNMGEVAVDKDNDSRPERWVLLAHEGKSAVASLLTRPRGSESWASNDAFFSRRPARAFDMAYWDDDGDENSDAFLF